jgi:glucan phosphorylase
MLDYEHGRLQEELDATRGEKTTFFVFADTVVATSFTRRDEAHLSILDGWWIEGCIEGVTGWAIDSTAPVSSDRSPHDAISLYNKLEQVVIPLFYRNRSSFIDMMRHAIALNGSFFSTQRMLLQYVSKAYFP